MRRETANAGGDVLKCQGNSTCPLSSVSRSAVNPHIADLSAGRESVVLDERRLSINESKPFREAMQYANGNAAVPFC